VFGGGRDEDIHKPGICIPRHGCDRNLFAQSISGLKEKDMNGSGWGIIWLVASSPLFGDKNKSCPTKKSQFLSSLY
jgi:hypothetical protein